MSTVIKFPTIYNTNSVALGLSSIFNFGNASGEKLRITNGEDLNGVTSVFGQNGPSNGPSGTKKFPKLFLKRASFDLSFDGNFFLQIAMKRLDGWVNDVLVIYDPLFRTQSVKTLLSKVEKMRPNERFSELSKHAEVSNDNFDKTSQVAFQSAIWINHLGTDESSFSKARRQYRFFSDGFMPIIISHMHYLESQYLSSFQAGKLAMSAREAGLNLAKKQCELLLKKLEDGSETLRMSTLTYLVKSAIALELRSLYRSDGGFSMDFDALWKISLEMLKEIKH